MELGSPINLVDEDKLEILERLDQFRLWHSLERTLLPRLRQNYHRAGNPGKWG
jgi:hypothetical protein